MLFQAPRLIDVCVLIGIVICLMGLFTPVHFQSRETSNRASCKSNLKQIGLATILYRDSAGKGGRYPAQNGSRFLVSLYVAGCITEPELFLCPSSGDSNAKGKLLTLTTAAQGTSYAGVKNRPPYIVKNSDYSREWFAGCGGNKILASDDDEGKTRFNHGDVVMVLSLHGDVEEIPLSDPRVSGGLGGGGWLDGLSN